MSHLNNLNSNLLNLLTDSGILEPKTKDLNTNSEKLKSALLKINDHIEDLESRISESENQFEKLKIVVDNTPCTISWINSDLEYMGVNETLCKITKKPLSEYVGKKLGFQTQDNYFYEFAKELFESQKQSLYKELISTLNDNSKHFWVVGSKYANNSEAVIIGIETTRLKETEKKLEVTEKLVDIDDLTGLYNMRSIFDKIKFELERGKRYKHSLAVVMMDMDHFKQVNDSHNHLFGSYVLSEVGKIIQKNLRSVDLGARYGGDEFLMVLTKTDEKGVRTFCERVRKTIEENLFKNGKDEIRLTSSFGYAITQSGSSNVSPESVVRAADAALYKSKDSGRNCVSGVSESHSPEVFKVK